MEDQKTEQNLWEKYFTTRDSKIKEKLIVKYIPLVKYVAGKLAMGMPSHIEYDELVSYGFLGLLDAVEKFNPNVGVKFKTYATTRIKGNILDELRANDWVPRTIRQREKKLQFAIQSLEKSLGRTASEKEIAEKLGISIKELNSELMEISRTTIISVNQMTGNDSKEGKSAIIDYLEDNSSLHPEIIVEKKEIHKKIVESLSDLPEKEYKVLLLYYYEDLTLKEIGNVLNVTESRVSQLHGQAIVRLRSRLSNILELTKTY